MKISEIINSGKLSLSFEVFPPKNDVVFSEIKDATEKIAEMKPSFISVTYGAGGGTSKYTLEIARNIKDKFNVPTLAHLTCISSKKETVLERIKELKDAGIKNIMALRGDIPDERKMKTEVCGTFVMPLSLLKLSSNMIVIFVLVALVIRKNTLKV